MADQKPGDKEHPSESPLLHAQEHKGYGDDEGEREQLLEEADDEQLLEEADDEQLLEEADIGPAQAE